PPAPAWEPAAGEAPPSAVELDLPADLDGAPDAAPAHAISAGEGGADAAPEDPAPSFTPGERHPDDPTPDDPRGYELDPGSGYLWHAVARHWFDPATAVYFDVDGNPLDAAEARAAAAPQPP